MHKIGNREENSSLNGARHWCNCSTGMQIKSWKAVLAVRKGFGVKVVRARGWYVHFVPDMGGG